MKIINKGTAQTTENDDAEDAYGVGIDGCYSHVVEFDGDDAGYLKWLHAHPDGYVVNVQRNRSPNYVVLHRATCIFISKPVAQGGYTERDYVKYCAETEVDAGYAAAICGRKRGSFSNRCGKCIVPEHEEKGGGLRTTVRRQVKAHKHARGKGIEVPGSVGIQRGLSGASAAGPSLRRRKLALADTARIAEEIAGDFYGGKLDLSVRSDFSAPGWSDMPEVACVDACRSDGVAEKTIRLLLTLVSAMDRARDSDLLWSSGRKLLATHPEIFNPSTVAKMPIERLSALLSASGVSQRHGPDSEAWQTIARSLATRKGPVSEIVERGTGNAEALLTDLQSVDEIGRARYPLLRGPKIGPMWVRIMANPGGTTISGIEKIPVAVDVHVRRVTRNLGVTDFETTQSKQAIQAAWHAAVSAGDVEGPSGIEGTCAALDPALWFFGKHGCRNCEAVSQRIPIGRACRRCVAFELAGSLT